MQITLLRSIVTLALMIAFASPVIGKTYLGSGGTSCGEYLRVKKTLPDVAQAIELWLLGYVSGLNMSTYSMYANDLLINQTNNDVIVFVNGYCATNEAKTLNNAVNEYWVQIVKRYVQ